ncbi:Phosphatidylglycerol phosphatidylinositol transfer [Lecanosticta acicola]|uniref:Phosphatidylglycerol/phosphatidylinositol transfer protein n=1 Tax=Lecanosticta acicola TaxID=111012 RepID=A0AAI9EBE2_9PEZI|nr:Phosphatidylglycerol phosphatidylinositol transfer [Lecanosticta acicola]
MKFLSVALPAILATSVTARVTSFFSSSDVSLRDDKEALKVPGENPLVHCEDPEKDILAIKKVDLTPNPPAAGQTLTFTAAGILAEDVDEGATVHLSVKYGLIKIINQNADLCDTVKNVDLECPLKKGDLTLTKDVDLPAQIPPGKYTVEADVKSKDGDKITCLQATVEFHRGGGASLFKQDM